jgi:hypothetical protein
MLTALNEIQQKWAHLRGFDTLTGTYLRPSVFIPRRTLGFFDAQFLLGYDSTPFLIPRCWLRRASPACTLMALATPLQADLNLGCYPKGHYTVRLNGANVGEFDT